MIYEVKFHGMKEIILLKKGDLITYIPCYGGQFLAIFLDKEIHEHRGTFLKILEQTGNIKNIHQGMIFKCKVLKSHEVFTKI